MNTLKLGRLPRKNNEKIRMMGSLKRRLPIPPLACDNTRGVTNFGMMLNDMLGDCTCAAVYHARQIWNGDTQPDSSVEELYERACGYLPLNPSTDQGGNEQDVLTYLLQNGMPLADGSVDKIVGFIEANHRNLDEVKLAVEQFGVAYIGLSVPSNIFDMFGTPSARWEYDPKATSEGLHAVVVVGYDEDSFTIVSWGSLYKLSYEFFLNQVDEVYAIASNDWLKQGKTPLGLDMAALQALMTELT
jgi:hypothetical protein